PNRSPTGNGTPTGAAVLAVVSATFAESVRVESVREAVSDWACSPTAMKSTATTVRAARMTDRAHHASSSWRHGFTRDGRCTRSYRAAAGTEARRQARRP